MYFIVEQSGREANQRSKLLRRPELRKLRERPIMQDYVEQRDGGYYLIGTRIALDSIVLAFKDGESPETIL